jgi:hypothetical protein
MWFVHRILELVYPHKSVLPSFRCILRRGKEKITASGWLPCHHSNVGYTLVFSECKANRQHFTIEAITDMKCCRRKKSTIPKVRLQPRFLEYHDLAEQSYTNVALWTLSVVYPSWQVVTMDHTTVFKRLVDDIENLCRRNVPHAIHVYDVDKAKVAIDAALKQMGELPYKEHWEAFEARMAWQLQTRMTTASRDQPSEHVRDVERYGHVWTTMEEITAARKIGEALTPHNTTLIVGSMSPSTTPEGSCIVVRNLEDAYRVQCLVDVHAEVHGGSRKREVYLVQALHLRENNHAFLKRLGVSGVQQLPANVANIQVAWAHLWSVDAWLALIATAPVSYTCIGRLDQYSPVRGQVFRDMCTTPSFHRTVVQHRMTENIKEIDTNDVEAVLAQIVRAHSSVQCMTDGQSTIEQNIDTGRRQLTQPYRIRTLRREGEAPTIRKPQRALQEEYWQPESCLQTNRSVVSVKSFNGVDVHAVVFICSENTTPFDIHVARTHAREALYILNPNQSFMSLNKECPKTCSVNPFVLQ